MKKWRYFIILTIFSGICAVFVLTDCERSASSGSVAKHLAIRDTAVVYRIEIEGTDHADLRRTSEGWILNDSLEADQTVVDNFLFAFHRLRIKGIPGKSEVPEDPLRIKIHIEKQRKPRTILYQEVNGADIMSKEGTGKYYQTEISGFPEISFYGIVKDESFAWRDHFLFTILPAEISEISVDYPYSPERNIILVNSEDSVSLMDPASKIFYPSNAVNKEKLRMFTSYFINIYFEDFLTEKGVIDSVLNVMPYMKIRIDRKESNAIHLDIWQVYRNNLQSDKHIYIRKNNEREILIGRHILTDLWGKGIKDFLLN